MTERFSILRPLKIEELEWLTLEILGFFSPLKSTETRQLLGRTIGNGAILPLSVNDFFEFMKRIKLKEEIEKYHYHVLNLIKKLEYSNFLCNAGKDKGFFMGRENCYYNIKEATKLQSKNLLWLGECLGLEYVQFRAKDFVIPITGTTINGDNSVGTGTLINTNTVLTCEHVLSEMKVDKTVCIDGKDVEIEDIKVHTKVDVGLIKLAEQVDLGYQIIFGDAFLLDEILTMGYPPVPMTRDAYLISQKGEINSLVHNYDGIEHFIYSSITRPGNSGGPIFTKRGHLVGISARHLERGSDADKNIVPFFEGITSREILNALRLLEPDILIAFEDYQ